MMIGNIVTKEKIKLNRKFNIVKNFTEIIDGIPTLIIGLDEAKLVSSDLNYIKRKISDDIFWTFNRKEKRTYFEEDLFYFIEFSYDRLIKPITYKFIDIIRLEDDDIKKLFKKLTLYDDIITFYYENNIYMFSNNIIYGIDTNQIKYISGDVDKLINKIKSISSVFLDDSGILIEYNNELELFNDEIKYIPLLYSINNHD